MAPVPVLRLFRCRPLRLAFDRILRDIMIPDLVAFPEVVAVYAGRQGPDELGDRIVASIWSWRGLTASTMGEEITQSAFHPEPLAETTDHQLEILPLALAVRHDAAEPALIRLARGTTLPGELDEYEIQVKAGAAADIAAGHGPIALYFAPVPPVEFVTLSLWREWTDVATTTGTAPARPISTRYSDHLVTFAAEHFEVLPSVARPVRRPAGPAAG